MPHEHAHTAPAPGTMTAGHREEPLTILKRRLAAGEISLQDYERLRVALETV